MIMCWYDVVCIVLVGVTVNHLGLVSALERVTGHRLYILNCGKCLTFWLTLFYGCYVTCSYPTYELLAISLLNAYLALWLELLEGFIDIIYNKVYETLYPTVADNPSSPTDGEKDSDSTLPELRESADSASSTSTPEEP